MRVTTSPLRTSKATPAHAAGQAPVPSSSPASTKTPVPVPVPSGASLASRGPASPGSSRLFDLRLQTLSNPPPADGHPDGVKFCAAAFADIRKRVATGEKCRVVFDLDNTLFDTRARTLEIAHAFDAANHTHHFDGLTVDKVAIDGLQTAQLAGMDPVLAERFQDFWKDAFWEPANLVHDTPMAPMVALARQAKEAGAEVVYLTGRNTNMQPASLAQLVRAGLPDANPEHLFCKNVGEWTPAYKAQHLQEWTDAGNHVGFFVTEGRLDISLVQKDVPGIPCLMLRCSLERTTTDVRPDTPALPCVF